MKKYQHVVFMQDSSYDEIENQVKQVFNIDELTYCWQYSDYKDKAIEILSQWDYGEYIDNPVNYDQFRNEIGYSANIYYPDNSEYLLITYGFLSAISLYRVIEE